MKRGGLVDARQTPCGCPSVRRLIVADRDVSESPTPKKCVFVPVASLKEKPIPELDHR